MPVAPVRAFLDGAPIDVDPTAIVRELAGLWRPAAQATGCDDLPPVTRVSLGTQVLVAPAVEAEALEATWAEVAVRHPSRALLVLVHEPGHPLRAAVSAACHLPAPGEPQVCSEKILLRVGSDALGRLPGLVLPLLEPDVPAALWWDLPDPPPESVCEQLCRLVDRLLVDLTYGPRPAEVYRSLDRDRYPTLSDLAWYRAGWWREGTARLFDGGHAAEAAAAAGTLEVRAAAGDEPGDLLPAALLAGWAAHQLGWRPHRRLLAGRSAWRRSDGRPARCDLSRLGRGEGRPGRLMSLRLSGPGPSDCWWRLERVADSPRELRLEAHHAHWCQLPTTMPAPRPKPVEVLLAAISGSRQNRVRDAALAHATWMLGWSEAGAD